MPVYEYRCTNPKCGHIQALFHENLDGGPATVTCTLCGKIATKILSVVRHAKKKKGRP